jgi:hypothetical protein
MLVLLWKVRAIAEALIKTDKIDSETLAHLLWANLITLAYALLKDIRVIKRVLSEDVLCTGKDYVEINIKALMA